MSAAVKILISTPLVGGVGGLERSIYSICSAFAEAEIDIYAGRIIQDGFIPRTQNVSLKNILEEIQAKRLRPKTYDIYIQYRTDSFYLLGKIFSAKKSFIIPAGNDISAVEHLFDYVLNEAPDGVRYLKNNSKNLVIPPPVFFVSAKSEKVLDIPDKYFLTVFNPYQLDRQYADGWKPYKGYDVLYEIVEQLACPLVWVNSSITNSLEKNIQHKANLIIKKNISQAQLTYLYENCTGYISFSREEGFGWAMADALVQQKPIISRPVGVMTYYSQEQYYAYANSQELLAQAKACIEQKETSQRDISLFTTQLFKSKLLALR